MATNRVREAPRSGFRRGDKYSSARSDAERAQQRERERELTVRAVAQLRTSAGWQAWLRVRARTGCAATAWTSPAFPDI
jgi:hypothetical protein